MDENVFTAATRLDEAEALLIVIELHNAGIHPRSFRLHQTHLGARAAERHGRCSIFGERSERAPAFDEAQRPDNPAKGRFTRIDADEFLGKRYLDQIARSGHPQELLLCLLDASSFRSEAAEQPCGGVRNECSVERHRASH
jgi:hypothetical protein